MINKTDMLKILQAKLTVTTQDNGPSKTVALDKNVVVSEMKNHFTPKTTGKSDLVEKIYKNKDLASPSKSVKFESWTPRIHDVKSITKRFMMEAEQSNATGQSPNAFRLNLQSIVMDKTHSKFTIHRGSNEVTIELLYPNANNQITLKIQLKGAEDKLLTIDTEDAAYTNNFSAYIIKEVDKLISELKSKNNINYGSSELPPSGVNANDGVGGSYVPSLPSLGGYSPVWESVWSHVSALIEADDDTEDDIVDDAAAGDVNNDADGGFGEDAFTADNTDGKDADMGEFTADFGGSGSMPSLGGMGDMGGGAPGGGGTSGGSAQSGEVEDTEYMKFRDKTDWTQASLDTMQKLTSDATASQMQNGSGIVLSANEVLNGTTGIVNDSNYQIIDKFLKVYTELDEVDIPEDMMNQLEDKLDANDGQFDSFLQQNLPKITGSDQVDDVLDNEMFNDFKPMGGEKPAADTGKGLDSFDSFMDDLGGAPGNTEVDDNSMSEGFGEQSPEHEEEIRKLAENDSDLPKIDEFPNLS